jgi:hypothetical protein
LSEYSQIRRSFHPRNLFLGYYVPYRHSIPLWELETDYYLHVKSGIGHFHSMKGYQRAFGVVEWNDEDDSEASVNEKSDASSSHTPSRTSRSNRQIDYSKQDLESSRIVKVQRRCKLQTQALSVWWKIAIQANIQRRMWMQLSRSPTEESILPPRFERLYRPEQLAQFDSFVARSWATPVRRTHPSQQFEGSDDEDGVLEFRRSISGRALPTPNQTKTLDIAIDKDSEGQGGFSLQSFVEESSFDLNVEPSRKMFLERHGIHDESSSGTSSQFSLKNVVVNLLC